MSPIIPYLRRQAIIALMLSVAFVLGYFAANWVDQQLVEPSEESDTSVQEVVRIGGETRQGAE